MHAICFSLVFILFFLALLNPLYSGGSEIYEYEKLWPALRQPRHFVGIQALASDRLGYLYIAESLTSRILKLTSDGKFVAAWGSPGTGSGQFDHPAGIAVFGDGTFFVADRFNNRIQKFSSDGRFLLGWGTVGNTEGRFRSPGAVAVDNAGFVYVADTGNDRIQKFSGKGYFVTSWGSTGSADGQFRSPEAVAVDNAGFVYVADTGNDRIQRFTKDGVFVARWGSRGSKSGEFSSPKGLAVVSGGAIHVADYGNSRIQTFTSDGLFLASWGGQGNGPGSFLQPNSIAVAGETVYVGESGGDRIQLFFTDGTFRQAWASWGNEKGYFNSPQGISVGRDGSIYVADSSNDRIQKFNPEGGFAGQWTGVETESGPLRLPYGVAASADGAVYVADTLNARVVKFSEDGAFILAWGSEGSDDGMFYYPMGISAGKDGFIYVADSGNGRVQKFSSDGAFIAQWGYPGEGSFFMPFGIAAVDDGSVVVADYANPRILRFSPAGEIMGEIPTIQGDLPEDSVVPYGIAAGSDGSIFVSGCFLDASVTPPSVNSRLFTFSPDGALASSWGKTGTGAGETLCPGGIATGKSGRVYVSDSGNNRIQVFRKTGEPYGGKAIVVAGGGPLLGSGESLSVNNLWPATAMNANFAYRTLNLQGFPFENIRYLSADLSLDLNGDGKPDIHAPVTQESLKSALTEWAKDATDVVLYLIDHGGSETFRLNESEVMLAKDLGAWLDDLQESVPGTVVVIYDACRSGSFLSHLTPSPGKRRILIAGTDADNVAWFMNGGTVSFSYLFWSRIFFGDTVFDAFTETKNSMEDPVRGLRYQMPQIDDDGNGLPNQENDGIYSSGYRMGKGIIPPDADSKRYAVVSAFPEKVLYGEKSFLIATEPSLEISGKDRVWSVVIPPRFALVAPEDPVIDLPVVDLIWNDPAGRFEGVYDGFGTMGAYFLYLFAQKGDLTVSLPGSVRVEQRKGRFADLPEGFWAEQDIMDLWDRGITKGCSFGFFCPDLPATRGQMAAFVIRSLFGDVFSFTQTPYFSDVPENHLFFRYVQKLKDENITRSAGIFGADRSITRQESAALIVRAKYGERFSYTAVPYYEDVSPENPFFRYIQRLRDDGIGTQENFRPGDPATRDVAAHFTSKMFPGE